MKRALKNMLRESVNGVILFDKRLSDCTTFRIGGTPQIWIEPSTLEDLRRALSILSKGKIEPFLIGNGSNLLVKDGRISRAVIKLTAPSFREMRQEGRFVTCGSGQGLPALIKRCVEKGLCGLEGLAGIPATVGGAITMNAGGAEGTIGDVIEWVRVIDYKGERERLLNKNKIKFKYRDSNFFKYIILEARFALRKCSSKRASRVFSETLKKKLMTQEYRWPNAGSVFKNPARSQLTSGQILERCGFKGAGAGEAEVSKKHANFIINKGNARFSDVMTLIKRQQAAAKKKFGVDLKPEIRILR